VGIQRFIAGVLKVVHARSANVGADLATIVRITPPVIVQAHLATLDLLDAQEVKCGEPPAAITSRVMRDIETIDSELRLVAVLRHAARERGGPLSSIDVADALLDERRGWTEWATKSLQGFHNSLCE
jgi:hypothetical protein